MAINLVQNPDGSASLVADISGSNRTECARFGGPSTPTVAAPFYSDIKIAKIPLTALDTAGAVFAWQPPDGVAVIVNEVYISVTTIATGACTLSVGTAANGTTSAANLIDTLDIHTAAGVFDNFTDKGTNGKSRQLLAAGSYVTGSVASGASAGLVGYAYIGYFAK